MLQPRICLLGLLPFRPIIRIGCRPTPAECGLDRPAARARQIAGVRMTRLQVVPSLARCVYPWSEVISSRDLLALPGHQRPVWLSRVPPTPMGQQRCADQSDLTFAPRTAPGHDEPSGCRT